MSFVHLHVHSHYSLLDGLSRIPALVRRTKELGMPAIALTDHGVMFGAIEFYREAKAAGIKPIIGLEAYMARRGMQDRDPKIDSRSFHLLLLAENDTGYHNLLKIASVSQLEGFYYKPRIDKDYLATHHDGLIVATGCLSGEVPRALAADNQEKAVRILDWYYKVFGPSNVFLELQDHRVPGLAKINKGLLELAKRYDGRLIATNDVHYINPEDAELQDILLCIQTGSVLSDPKRMRMTDDTYYLRSPKEMEDLFGSVPGAIENTLEIAERCNVDLDFHGYQLPEFDVPKGNTPQTYLRKLCLAGLQKRYGEQADDPQILERLEYELKIIHQMDFDAYFLIVWDLCRHARELSIWYNARGSAAGSIVGYCLEITMVDPIKHQLIFERFLNPGRVSMPDIDLDFQDDKRFLLLQYCAEKYGHDKVAQIITFGTLGARAAIRDVGRVMDIPLPEVDRVAKLIPNIPGKPVSISKALESIKELKDVHDNVPYIQRMVDTAAQLEGVARNAGTHACGVLVTPKALTEYVPLHRPTGGGGDDNPIHTVSQYEMQIVDYLGLLKIDFLGLSTLTVMAKACKLISKRHSVDFDIHSIPVDDQETYELLGRGETLGVFQVEGAGMRRNLMEMKPHDLVHVIAMVALFRPGPMEFIPSYIRRMHGQEEVSYIHPALKPVLEETYGITVYQEQIMYTAMNLAGYTASEADFLRKAVAKKKAKALHQQRSKFVEGAVEKGISEKNANEIFDNWEAFARYGFPKGHAADYGVICVKTAYLKAHYAIEYMTALMSVFRNDTDKVALYIAECRRMGHDVLPPDVNYSSLDFEIEDRPNEPSAIRYGMAAIKNVGEGPVRVIIDACEQGGTFRNILEFTRHVDLRHVGKRALESLIRVGALDCLGARPVLLESIDRIISMSAAHFRAKEQGQLSLFGADTGIIDTLELPAASAEVSHRTQLSWEKELLGVYVSDHPLTPYMDDLSRLVSHFSSELEEVQHNQSVCVAGEVAAIRRYQTRSGKAMGFISLADLQGTIELVVFPRVWQRINEWLKPGLIVVVKGKADCERRSPKVLVDSITTEISSVQPLSYPETRKKPPVGESIPVSNGHEIGDNPQEYPYNSGQNPATEIDVESQDNIGIASTYDGVEVSTDPAPLDDVKAGEDNSHSIPVLQAGGRHEAIKREAIEQEDSQEGVKQPAKIQPGNNGDSVNAYVIDPQFFKDKSQKLITIVLKSTMNRKRDILRTHRIYGLLTSFPGNDHFIFNVYEASRRYHMEFPNTTTGFCPELYGQLRELLGEACIQIKLLHIE